MKKNLCVLMLLLSSVSALLASTPGDDIIIKQSGVMEILYAVSAADPQGPRLDIASIFVASTKTMIEDDVVLEPGLFVQDGERILSGMLAYTGVEPILLYVKSEAGVEAFPVFPGERITVGTGTGTGTGTSNLYCDYCRCICSPNDPDPAKLGGSLVIVDPLPVGANYAYFTWNGILDCASRNGEACETTGGDEGTMSKCKKVSRKCL